MKHSGSMVITKKKKKKKKKKKQPRLHISKAKTYDTVTIKVTHKLQQKFQKVFFKPCRI